MKTVFDSSVLIAACVESHPRHLSAYQWLHRAKNKELEFVVSAHSIAEVYSVLTAAPFEPRISSLVAKRIIDQNIRSQAKIIHLIGQDYFQMVDKMSQYDFSGGIIFDAIVLECARKSKSEQIITSNQKDFNRLIKDQTIKIISI